MELLKTKAYTAGRNQNALVGNASGQRPHPFLGRNIVAAAAPTGGKKKHPIKAILAGL